MKNVQKPGMRVRAPGPLHSRKPKAFQDNAKNTESGTVAPRIAAYRRGQTNPGGKY